MIIDMHTHYGAGVSKTGFSSRFLLSQIRKGVMDGAVIFPIKGRAGVVNYTKENRALARFCRRKPLTGFMRINCLSKTATIRKNIEEGISFGLKGIKLHTRDDGWDAGSFSRICAAAEDNCLPIVMHTENSYSRQANIEEIMRNISGYRHNRFILAHGDVTTRVAKMMSRNRNISIDTSIKTAMFDIRLLLRTDQLSYRQILFASDYPFGLPSYERFKLEETFRHLRQEKRLGDALGGNARRLLGI